MNFTCEYCDKKFKHERNYEKHFCESEKRWKLARSKMGGRAFYFFIQWRKMKGYTVCDKLAFSTSKYFKSFINFSYFAEEKLLPDRMDYIKYMVELDVMPMFWMNEIYYNDYISKYDQRFDTMKQVRMSVGFLDKLAAGADCDINDILKNLEFIDIMKMVVRKRISMWLLLFMDSFQELIKHNLNQNEKILLTTFIDFPVWQQKISSQPELVEEIKSFVRTLGI